MLSNNNLSFSISVVNNANPALTSLQKQVTSLKNGISSIGSGTNSATSVFTKFGSAAKTAASKVGTLGSIVSKTIGIFTGLRVVNTIFNTITSSMDKAINRIDTMDLFTRKMTMITNDSNKATAALEALKTSTKGTPYALDMAAKGVQNFVLRGMETEDAVDSINIWMDAVSTYGKGTNEQFESVIDAIAKMRTKGTVEMRYLNRLFNAGINPVQMYAQATGQAAQDVQTALSAKEISSKEFLDVVEQAMRDGTGGVLAISGNAKKMATTWAATIANMKIAFSRGWASIIQDVDNAFKAIDPQNGLKGVFKRFGEVTENVMNNIGSALKTILVPVLSIAKQAYGFWETYFVKPVSESKFVKSIADGFNVIRERIEFVKKTIQDYQNFLDNKGQFTFDSPDSDSAKVIQIFQNIKKAIDGVKEALKPLNTAFNEALNKPIDESGVKSAFSDLLDIVVKFTDFIAVNLPKAVKVFANFATQVIRLIKPVGEWFWNLAVDYIAPFAIAAANAFTTVAIKLTPLIEGFVGLAAAVASFIVPKAFEILTNILNWIAQNADIVVSAIAGIVAGLLTFQVVSALAKTFATFSSILNTLVIPAVTTFFEVMTTQGIAAAISTLINPVVLIPVAVAALVALAVGLIYLYTTSDTAREKILEFTASFLSMSTGIPTSADQVETAFNKIGEAISWLNTKIQELMDKVDAFFDKLPALRKLFAPFLKGVGYDLSFMLGDDSEETAHKVEAPKQTDLGLNNISTQKIQIPNLMDNLNQWKSVINQHNEAVNQAITQNIPQVSALGNQEVQTLYGSIDNAINQNGALDLSTMTSSLDYLPEQGYLDGSELGLNLDMGAQGSIDALDGVDASEYMSDIYNIPSDGYEAGTGLGLNLASGVASTQEAVSSASAGVSGLALGSLSSTLAGDPTFQVGVGFINAFNSGFLTQASATYQLVAVFANNIMTQFAAGFASSEQVPNAIAIAMIDVVRTVSNMVVLLCQDIKTQLTVAKTETEVTTSALATAIQNNFTTAQTTASASMQAMVDSLIFQYQRLKDEINGDLGAIETAHVTYSDDTMNYYVSTVTTNLDTVYSKYSDFDTKIRGLLNSLKDYHNQVAIDMMQGMINGFNTKMPEVLSKENELVVKLKETFEKGLGIHSPSRWGEWIGQMLIAGMINGLSGDKLSSFVAAIISDMQASFKAGNFNADELVDYMGNDGTLNVVKYLELIGDQTVSDLFGDGGVPPIIQEALKYVGYAPGGGNSMFGLYYGNPGAWCASFVRYCAEKVGVPFPPTNYVPDVLDWSIANGKYTTTPQPGYAAIFGGGSHIELVAGVGNGTVDMVGGNTGMGEVKHRPRSDATSYVALDGGHSTMTLKDTIMQAYNKRYNPLALLLGGSGTPAGYDPNGGAEQWRSTVLQALQMLGQPASLVDGVLYAIQNESGGNPNAVNNWDINAQRGDPSRGLLQTIGATFNAYRNPNLSNNIYDPLSNIYAALNYMINRYGSVANVINPRMGGWYGYSVGTRYVPADMFAMIHKGEAILPASQNPYSQSGGDYLGDLARNAFGDQGISEMSFDVGSALSAGNTTNNNSNISQNNNFTINNSSDVDADRNLRNMEMALHNMLQNGQRAGSSR